MRSTSFAFLLAALVFCGAATAAPATRYSVTAVSITDLGTLGGSSATALDINDNGEIVGWAETTNGRRHAFIYRAAMMEDIGSVFGANDSEASGINRTTRVVGTYRDPAAPSRPQAFVWDGGLTLLLNDSYAADCAPSRGSEAFAISDSNYIAGRILCSAGLGGTYEAARWTNPFVYALLDHLGHVSWRAPPFVWNSVAYDVNTSGMTVGRTKDIEQMVRWNIPSAPGRDMIYPPLGTRDATWPDDGAKAINDAGAVVGRVKRSADSLWRAFWWAGPGTTAVDLGVLPGGVNSYGDDLNEQTFIAGSADLPVSFGSYTILRRVAFIHHWNFGMRALPVLPGTTFGTCEAHAINERVATNGRVQLVGYCQLNSGARRAVRWDVTVSIVSTQPPGPTP